ncbi:MAG: phospho-sugar mutase [Myxococcota bacterium]|nr:phospho-sugar mutase [Myxococcota bacterium]
MSDIATLRDRAARWAAADPDPETSSQTRTMVEQGDDAALRACFGARLGFGTAGIRGTMGPGPNRMNLALVRQVTWGLARYLLRTCGADALVVVGRDGRRNSARFMETAARLLAHAGLQVRVYDGVVPTPVLAHAVKALGAQAGVMITASHNPPDDNGYKVYWGNGAQIVPPHDGGIAAEIAAIGGPWGVPTELAPEDRIQPVPAEVDAAYERKVLALRVHSETGIKAVYTAMHGVGWAWMDRIARAAGHAPLVPVPEQVEPDGAFPTVAFPNPEEPGALDLAKATAARSGAELIVAHDPDADRLAVCVPDGEGWRQLTGNEVGILLADDLLAHGPPHERRLVATTIVSTSLLGRVAELHGAHLAETLTGFKWIANAAIDWDGPFVLGFEEALGYSAGPVVSDKDGVSAAMLLLDLASWCRARGVTMLDHLADLYRRIGYAASHQFALKLPGAEGKARIAEIMDGLRAAPPTMLAGATVHTVRDVQTGLATDTATGSTRPLDLPRSNVLAFDLDDGGRVLARPSGTEPKVKFYFEVRAPLAVGEPLSAAEQRAATRMAELEASFLAHAGI